MKQFQSFIHKEFLHIARDPRTMLFVLAMPIMQILLFGFAISTEVKNVRLAVVDQAKDPLTAQIINRLAANEYISLERNLQSVEQSDTLFRQSKIDMVAVFAPDFSKNPRLQILADASDPNTAQIGASYVQAIAQSVLAEHHPAQAAQAMPVMTTTEFLYNPSQLSAYNFVPGVMGMVLMMICAMMTSISIVREKELGTMEVLLVSPIHPFMLIVAKLVPYLTLSAINVATILLLSVFVLGVPIVGSLTWLLLFSLLFVFVTLALGLLISTIAKTQVVAMLISGMVLMMPTVLLSGMMFPVDNMPVPLQWFSTILPARWFISGVRKLMIQGVEVEYVGVEFLVLGIMAIVLLVISLRNFKIRL